MTGKQFTEQEVAEDFGPIVYDVLSSSGKPLWPEELERAVLMDERIKPLIEKYGVIVIPLVFSLNYIRPVITALKSEGKMADGGFPPYALKRE